MDSTAKAKESLPKYWCNICSLDLQSLQSLDEHEIGRKHKKKLFRIGLLDHPPDSNLSSITTEEELFRDIANGKFKNIVVLTGAGISTASGIPDYRSSGGYFEILKHEFGGRFSGIEATPENLFSRNFVNQYPHVWENELLPTVQKQIFQDDLSPTIAHKFCSYLHHQGWLKRIYTQNIDGLHLHPSLNIPDEKVVECHGSVKRGDLVLYGDSLPEKFFRLASDDFSLLSSQQQDTMVDLVLIFGTSLQVAPFCGLPNMALRECTRVLVNRSLSDCYQNSFSSSFSSYGSRMANTTMTIGTRKNVPLQSLWLKSRAKKWRQLMVEDDCDDFVKRFLSFQNVMNVEDLCNI